jgi:hypothetical protein
MTYALVLDEHENGRVTRDIGENVFLRDLSEGYQVFAFYYPSAMRDERLAEALRDFGDLTGKNLFVNLGKFNDPNFGKIVNAFGIKKYPVVVLTATKELASAEDVNVYVRIDSDRLLSDPARAVEAVQEIFGLFLRGEVAAAISKAKWTQRSELAVAVAKTIASAGKELARWIAERDVSVSVVGGSFEIKKSGS